ncbi:hypothetical protein SMMN14_09477, partial [Sphaerulina musiva]
MVRLTTCLAYITLALASSVAAGCDKDCNGCSSSAENPASHPGKDASEDGIAAVASAGTRVANVKILAPPENPLRSDRPNASVASIAAVAKARKITAYVKRLAPATTEALRRDLWRWRKWPRMLRGWKTWLLRLKEGGSL